MLIRLSLILALFYSCSMKDSTNQNNNKINLHSEKIYNYENNLFDLSIIYEISNNHFVFIKNNNSFKARISTTIQIYDVNNDSIIIQNSWIDEIIEPDYNDTRSSSKYFSFNKTLNLLEGVYHLKVNVQDRDNGNVFKSEDKIDLSLSDGFGELFVYTLDQNGSDDILLKDINEKSELYNNNIRLSFQFFGIEDDIEELLIELDDSNSKYAEKYFNLPLDDQGFYSIDFTVPDNFYNNIDLTLSVSEHSLTKEVSIKDPNNQFWTNDINEIIFAMRYILPVSEIKALKRLEIKEKREYISNYWLDKDPDPSTQKNDLLVEFVDRVKFSNLKFSDLNKGYRTDRGRIYIIYGPPENVETYSSQYEGVYQVWKYPSGFNFVFLDRNGFGNFVLLRQTL